VRDFEAKRDKLEIRHGTEGGAKGGKDRVIYSGSTAHHAFCRYHRIVTPLWEIIAKTREIPSYNAFVSYYIISLLLDRLPIKISNLS
jgi:hypothetical protein